jgi:hypothetical protein
MWCRQELWHYIGNFFYISFTNQMHDMSHYLAYMGNGVCWLHGSARCMGEIVTETQDKDKMTHLHLSSCVGVLLGDMADLWVKGFGHTAMWSQIQLTCTVMAPMWGRTMGSAPSGSWIICTSLLCFCITLWNGQPGIYYTKLWTLRLVKRNIN